MDALVRKGAAPFKQLGAQVDEVSIPLLKILYVTNLIDAHSSWRLRAGVFSDTLKTTALSGQYALNK